MKIFKHRHSYVLFFVDNRNFVHWINESQYGQIYDLPSSYWKFL